MKNDEFAEEINATINLSYLPHKFLKRLQNLPPYIFYGAFAPSSMSTPLERSHCTYNPLDVTPINLCTASLSRD